jgi:RNA polymerase-binding protein DksA
VHLRVCYRPAPMSPARKKTARKKATTGRARGASKTSKKKGARKSTGSVKRTTRKSSATRSGAKTTRRKTAAKKATRKTAAKKATRKKAGAKKTNRATPKKTSAGKSTARKKPAKKKRSGARAAAGKPGTRRPARGGASKPPARKSTSRRRAAKFDKAQLAAIREELESERSGLQGQLDELSQDSFDGTQSELTGEVGVDDDFADAGSATFERERDLSIQNNIRDLIDQTTRAIHRIDDGNYGTCERCGNPIEAARLKALPHALLCMDCKRREERAR